MAKGVHVRTHGQYQRNKVKAPETHKYKHIRKIRGSRHQQFHSRLTAIVFYNWLLMSFISGKKDDIQEKMG